MEPQWWNISLPAGGRINWRIVHLEETTSTNDVAKEKARQGEGEGLVVVAETQTRGRGRHGREWASPRGGIWASILLRPEISPEHAHVIVLLAAVATAEAVEEATGLEPQIRWPNDLLLDGRKFCGILCESSVKQEKLEFVVVGIGINANVELKSLPEEVRETATTLMHELKRPVSRSLILENLLRNVDSYYEMLLEGKTQQILDRWRKRDITLGRWVEIRTDMGLLRGLALDIDKDGALLVQSETGLILRLKTGDVYLLRF